MERDEKGQMREKKWRLITCPPRRKTEKRKQRVSKVLGYEFLHFFFLTEREPDEVMQKAAAPTNHKRKSPGCSLT